MLSFNLIVFSLVLFAKLSIADRHRFEDLSNLVLDVIENEQIPSILWAITCWPKTDEFNFIKKCPYQIRIANSNEPIILHSNENTNKQWFFMDANCAKRLKNVDEKYFAHPYRWIIADITNVSIQELSFLPGSNIILANRDGNLKEYNLKQGLMDIKLTKFTFSYKRFHFLWQQFTKFQKKSH